MKRTTKYCKRHWKSLLAGAVVSLGIIGVWGTIKNWKQHVDYISGQEEPPLKFKKRFQIKRNRIRSQNSINSKASSCDVHLSEKAYFVVGLFSIGAVIFYKDIKRTLSGLRKKLFK